DANNPFAIQLASSQAEAIAASSAVTARNGASNTTSTLVPTTVGSIQPSTSTTGNIIGVDPVENAIVLADPSPGFQTGDPVTFHQAVNNGVGGLSDGVVYYAIAVPNDPNAVQLAATRGGQAIPLSGNSRLVGGTQTLAVRNTDASTGTIFLGRGTLMPSSGGP